MTKSFNRVAVYAVFNDADNMSASLAERLFALGIASRSEARPLAMEWAIEDTKRKAIKAGKPVPTVNKVDAVDAVLKKYKALTASEKRRFLKSI